MRYSIGCVVLGLLWGAVTEAGVPMPAITHYEIKMDINPAEERIACACRLTITNISNRPWKRIELLLNRGLAVREDHFFIDNEPGEYREKLMGLEGYGTIQVNRISFTLPKPLEVDESTVVQMNYYGNIMGFEAVLSYLRDSVNHYYTLLRDETFAYPILTSFEYEDAWGEKPPFTYDVEISVPTGQMVAGSGERIKALHEEDKASYRFRSKDSATRMAFAMAQFHMSANEEKDLAVYALPEHKEFDKQALEVMESAVDFYRAQFGAPSRKHGFTAIDIPQRWGSQVGAGYFLQPLPRFADVDGKRSAFGHIAHSWTVEALPEAQASGWFDVGFATYFKALAIRQIEGADAFSEFLKKSADSFVKRVRSSEDIGSTPIAEYDTPRLARNSATKGALALFVLHELVGDGDFRKIISTLISEHSIAPAGFDDFERIAERVSGKDLRKLFAEWIYGAESSKLLLANTKLTDIAARYR